MALALDPNTTSQSDFAKVWRGPAFADVRDEPFARASIGRLDELRMAALADRIDADLALGRHAQLAGELAALVAEHPLQEGLRAKLMLALYGSGQQSAALAVYRDARCAPHADRGTWRRARPGAARGPSARAAARRPAPVAGPAPRAAAALRATAQRRLLTYVVAVPHDVPAPGGGADPGSGPRVLLDMRSRIAGPAGRTVPAARVAARRWRGHRGSRHPAGRVSVLSARRSR